MTDQNPEQPSKFKQEWEAKRLLKQAKKKARKTLQQKGFSQGEATKLVKQSIKRIASDNRPERKAAGRGG